jgi:hypothetical protein
LANGGHHAETLLFKEETRERDERRLPIAGGNRDERRLAFAMLKALIWKEWREQRSLVLAGLGLAAMLPLVALAGEAAFSGAPRLRGVAEVLPVIFAIFLWPLAALASGANAFAGERGGAAAGFLLSRPVRRPLVWMTKVSLAALATALVIAGSLIVALGVRGLAVGAATMGGSLRTFDQMLDAQARAVFGPAPLLLVFAAAIHFSTRRSRPLTATISGLLASLLLISLIAAAWSLTGLDEDVREIWFALEISVAATLLLIASGRRFASAEALGASNNLEALASVASIGLLTVLLGFTPVIHADLFADWKKAVVAELTIDPAGASIIVAARSSSSVHGSLWRLGSDGTARRLTGRMTFSPFVSPDGAWIYYLSQRGPFGLAGRRADLRAVRADGSDDRLIARSTGSSSDDLGTWGFGRVLFSPSGSKVVPVYYWNDAQIIVDLDRGETLRIGPGALIGRDVGRLRGLTSLAWINEAEFLLLVARSNRGGDQAALVRYNLTTRQAKVVYEERSETGLSSEVPNGYLDSRPAPRKFPIVFRHSGSFDVERGWLPDSAVLRVIDLDTGAHEEIAAYSCRGPETAISASGRVLAFTRFRCQVDAEGRERIQDVELYVRDLETGEESGPLAAGRSLDELRVSPDGDRVHVSVWDGAGTARSLVIERDGTRRELSVRRLVGGRLRAPNETTWLDNDRLFVFYGNRSPDVLRPWEGEARLAIIDANSGAVVAEHVWR